MGHVRDLWTTVGPHGRRVRTDRHGRGKRWVARWEEAGRTRSKAFATKDAATAHLARVELDAQAGRPVGAGQMTVAQWVEGWLPRQVHWRASTRVNAEQRLRVHVLPAIGHVRLVDLTRRDLQDLVAGVRLAPAGVRVAWSYAHSALTAAAEEGLVDPRVLQGVRLPRVEKTAAWMPTLEEAAAIRDALPGWARVVVPLAAGTGMRPGEWAGLCWEQVDERAGTVHVDRQLDEAGGGVFAPPKTRSSDRVMSLAPETLAAMREHREAFGMGAHGLVVVGARGALLGRRARGELWRPALRRAGVATPPRSGWHALRHLHASLLIRGGLSAVAVAARLGHAGPGETLSTYAHLWGDDDQRAVGVVSRHLGGL